MLAVVPEAERIEFVPVLVDRLKLDVRLISLVVDRVEYLDTDLFSCPSLLISMSRAISSKVLFFVSGTLK